MRPAAMPALSAISGVKVALMRPRMPSVPKNLRFMKSRPDGYGVLPPFDNKTRRLVPIPLTGWRSNPGCRLLRMAGGVFPYGFQYLEPGPERGGIMGTDEVGAGSLGEQLRGQACGGNVRDGLAGELSQEALAGDRNQHGQAEPGLQLGQAAKDDQGIFRIGADELAHAGVQDDALR